MLRLALLVGLVAAIVFLLLVLVELVLGVLLLHIEKVRLSRFFEVALWEVGVHVRRMIEMLSAPYALHLYIIIRICSINRLQIIQQEVVPLQAVSLFRPFNLLRVS